MANVLRAVTRSGGVLHRRAGQHPTGGRQPGTVAGDGGLGRASSTTWGTGRFQTSP